MTLTIVKQPIITHENPGNHISVDLNFYTLKVRDPPPALA